MSSDQQPNVGKTVKGVVGGVVLLFSPVLIIFGPVWAPLFLIYWVYNYLTGKHPIGAGKVDYVRDKIVESVEEVKNKVEQLGKEKVIWYEQRKVPWSTPSLEKWLNVNK
uniref:Putative oleosin n=1 Tax=Helianthus annuus TaxID=4232 RepID=A0A251SVE4_HELAN